MGIAADREIYVARARRTESGIWALSFAEWPEIEVFVFDILHAEGAAREQIAATRGLPVEAFEVRVDVELSGLLDGQETGGSSAVETNGVRKRPV